MLFVRVPVEARFDVIPVATAVAVYFLVEGEGVRAEVVFTACPAGAWVVPRAVASVEEEVDVVYFVV